VRDKYFLFLFLFIFTTILDAQIKLKFVTVNQYGNNLYIDNVTAGSQFNTDVAAMGITNIKPDTSYAIGSAQIPVAPQAMVINVGKNNISANDRDISVSCHLSY